MKVALTYNDLWNHIIVTNAKDANEQRMSPFVNVKGDIIHKVVAITKGKEPFNLKSSGDHQLEELIIKK